jgi:putative addiction module antidote
MTRTLKIRRVGGSLGAIFPKELLERIGAHEDDEIAAIETADGVLLKARDPDFDAAIAAFEDVRHRYRNTLRRLAE